MKNDMLKNLGLLAGIMLVMFVAAEMVLRSAHRRELQSIESRHPGRDSLKTIPSDDPRLIYTISPAARGSNSQGYMDSEHTKQKPAGVYRIVIIGDSVAQGWEILPALSFAKVLERELNTAADSTAAHPPFEIIVLARLGYSTSQELVLFEEEAFEYDPDLILWSYCLNDPAHPVYHNANGELGRYYYKPTSYAWYFVARRLFHLRQRIKARNCNGEYHSVLHCVYWDQVETDIRRIAGVANERGVPCVFMIHPVFQEGIAFSQYTLRGLHIRLADTATEAGLIPLDLLPAFEPYPPEDIKLHRDNWYDPWHPNLCGHRILAGYMRDFLQTQMTEGRL